LAKNGCFRFRFGSQLFALSESENSSPCLTPGCTHSSPGSPFFTSPCRSGRSAASFFRIFVPVYYYRQDDSLARSGPACYHHRRRLRSGPPPRLGAEIWRPGHHHKRQRPTIYISIVGQPLFSPLNQTYSDDCLPSSIERPCGTLPPPPQGCSPRQGGRSRLVLAHSLGVVRFQDSLERGFGFLTVRGCFWFTVGFARAVPFHS
jgi:hypothetical protein